MDADGDTVSDPLVWTDPIPLMKTSVEFRVRHVKAAGLPGEMLAGSTQIDADWSENVASVPEDGVAEE